MKSALSAKVAGDEIIVLEDLHLAAPKTKDMIKILESVNASKKALIVTAEKDEAVVKSAANIPGVRTTIVTQMNVYDIVNHTSFIVTKQAVDKIQEVYAK
jgi:large subunit ribosomal protein L4